MSSKYPDTHLYDLPILELMRENGVPGASLAVVNGGRIVEERAYGTRVAGGSSVVTSATRFQACSISKPVTALAMLRLVERGELDLDADVNDVLSAWQVPANGSWQPRVTLRQIASHSAGLTVHGFPGYPHGTSLPTLVQILSGTHPANSEAVRVDIVPGVQVRYSGGGTTVMQLLLEESTGEPVADLIRGLVLGPLGMDDSGYEQPLPRQLCDQAATAHLSDGAAVPGSWHTYPEKCAAGLWTTPGDLARFAMGIQRARAGEPGALISKDMATQMLTAQTPPAPGAERIAGFSSVGLGPFIKSVDGRTTYFGHSGANEGFRCHLLAHRDLGIGAAVMTNGDGGSSVVQEAFDAIAREYAWPDYASDPVEPAPPHGAELDAFSGSFELPHGDRIEVARVGDVLNVVVGDQRPNPFFASDPHTLSASFVDTTLRYADGTDDLAAASLVLCQGGAEHHCRRLG